MRRTTPTAALLLFTLAACAGGANAPATHEPDDGARAEAPETRALETGAPAAGAQAPAEPEDSGDIPRWVDGRSDLSVSRAAAREDGLTVLDLGDGWAPAIFREDERLGPRGRQPFLERLIRLQNEEREHRRDPSKRYLELFGIFPSFHVLRERLADDERHRCHDAVDDAPIAALGESLRPGADMAAQRRRANGARYLRNRLERVMERRNIATMEALGQERRYAGEVRRLRRLEAEVAAIRSVQAHLRCEGFLSSRADDGVLDAWTGSALRAWQSKHMIISLASRLDDATRATLTMDSRELDFLSLLRSLRERVAGASGILEDGTASNDWGTVLGRQLQVDDEFRWADRLDPMENGAPDLLSRATEAAARSLGWTDPAAARAWLDAHHPARTPRHLVAVGLPPPPAYHSAHMELRVEIDRGDVWYQFPYTDAGVRRGFPVRQRPMTVIYAVHEGRDIPLVRWNTTIGSWQPEINPEGGVGMRYKESDVGPRVWRDIVASPAWLPPPSTPDDELLRRNRDGWRVNTEITGPGYDSAYGLTMVIHHLVRGDGEDERDWIDRGIRSHGSVSYRSILRGYSHGCHRLFNHLAVRMNSFLLTHRRHEVRGQIPAMLRRELQPEDSEETLTLEIDNRGFRFELTPPVPVEVRRGNVRGSQSRPLEGFFPLPEQLQAQAREAAEADPSPSGSAAADPTPAGGAAQ